MLKFQNLFIIFFFGMLLFLSLTKTDAAKYFVSSASEIANAMALVQPGDSLIMKKGTWTNQKIVFQKNGTALNKIYLLAEVDGEVLLNGTSTLRIAGDYLVVSGLQFIDGYSSNGGVIDFKNGSLESNYCRLTNTAIINYNPSDNMADYKWISLYGTHNRVDHCYLKGKTHIGTSLVVWLSDKPNYHQIDSNYFAYRPTFPENGAETIRVGTSEWSMYNSFTTVEYNYFEQCNGETEIISNKSCGNIYRYNTFKECEGTLTLRHGNNCTVEGNFFFCGNKSNAGGIRIIGEDHKVLNNYIENSSGTSYKSGITLMNGVPDSPLNRYFQVKRAIVAFNTLYNCKETLNIGGGKDSELSLSPIDCIIANNIFTSAQSPIITFTDQPQNMTWSGNIFFGTSIGTPLPAGNYSVNPQLSNSSGNIYRLLSSSPAINASNVNYNYVAFDIDGQSRIGINDIGADEYSTEAIKIKPMSAADTGPTFLRAPSAIGKTDNDSHFGFELFQNYPNPFNPMTIIRYQLPQSCHVELRIFDTQGKEIASLLNEYQAEGMHQTIFDSKKFNFPSGIYFYRLTAGNASTTQKMVVMK